ncbi:MAG: endopeptidase La [Desulfovibrio sp.]|jgi:ATP-dependent Lon protease|nr:endopeptidase La [Desulfovibrio sp.]
MAISLKIQTTMEIPLMPLREVVMFPRAVAPLFVGREGSIKAIKCAIEQYNRQIFLVAQRDSSVSRPEEKDLFGIGTVCRILQLLNLPDGTIKVLVEGLHRARWQSSGNFFSSAVGAIGDPTRPGTVVDLKNGDFSLHEGAESFQLVRMLPFDEEEAAAHEAGATQEAVHEVLEEYGKFNKKITNEVLYAVTSNKNPGALADAVAPLLKADYLKKQEILEEPNQVRRLDMVFEFLQREVSYAGMDHRIKNRVKRQMERNNREYYLNEQIKAINKEMGRDEDPEAELKDLEARVAEKNMPDECREKVRREIKKLRHIPTTAAEYTVSRNYVDWILDLPWNILKETMIDLDRARTTLDADHFGLDKAKERILEYLAVQKLVNKLKGPILCLVGPPGVGKTSLAKSVATATGREFVRLSLGGVRDEAEIRGHRRTYVGALPGKIIQSLKRVRFNNPLFCLDEIDKLSTDFRGDPASALLEVLDPEQNHAFADHYLDMDYDLSQIFFITTANSLHSIPLPLQDRMEIIKLPGYLETEKHSIGKFFLLPKQVEAHGLETGNLRLSDNSLLEIIRSYTKEAGVRGLEREIAAICRKSAMQIVESGDLGKQVTVTCQNISQFLGVKKFRYGEREDKVRVGVCTGLAYTELGGELLMVETAIMPGSGKVSTTGKLGEVMQESASAALSYVRSRADSFGLRPDFHKDIDIHIHVPEGATPKDGPSAGITLTASLVSALLGLPLRNDLAMTGEITLRGRVLPIGGLREKLLAAHRGLISTVIVPKDNEKDIKDVPDEILKGLNLVFVSHVDEVLPLALVAGAGDIYPEGRRSNPLYLSLRHGPDLGEGRVAAH